MSSIQEIPTIFTITTTSTSASINMHNSVPRQVIYLQAVRFEMTSSAVALAQKVAYVELSFMSKNHLIDGIQNRHMLPILLQNASCTHYTCNLALTMDHSSHETIQVRVLNADGSALADFVHMALVFSCPLSNIS